jgi:hypothetical protein
VPFSFGNQDLRQAHFPCWTGTSVHNAPNKPTTSTPPRKIEASNTSLITLCNKPRDLWSSRGLGQTAGRVYDVLADEPATLKDLGAQAGLSYQSTRHATAKLADHCLAGVLPGRPLRYFKVETPLSVVEDLLECSGYVDHVIAKTERRQEANKRGYPSNYSEKATTQ